MAKLIYSAIASLDGYIEDEAGEFGWAAPDAEVHAFVNDLERPLGTHIYGRRMYETMAFWETDEASAESQPAVMHEFAAIWREAEKVVYSRSLEDVSSERTRIERSFEPAAIRGMKDSAVRDIGIGGPDLAGQAIAAGLVDECHLLLAPIAVGAGKPALPARGRLELELLDERRFESGFVHLHYRLRSEASA